MNNLIYPGDPIFERILATALPPNVDGLHVRGDAQILVECSSGLLRWVDGAGLDEYVFGGEFEAIAADDDDPGEDGILCL